ncbi:MAG TPA: hypothetical protein VKD71_04895 [Gemmataceae bacterium]|nr:hypothetical protein [Gemmataceae bacterium]
MTLKLVAARATVSRKDVTWTIDGRETNGAPAGQSTLTLHGEFFREGGENRFESLFRGGQGSLTAEVTDEAEQTFVIDVGAEMITTQ